MSPARFFFRARIGVYLLVLAALCYLVLRYDLVSLPAEGCSPVLALEPGSSLLVDTFAEGGPEGSVLLFRDPSGAGELLLGAVAALPASAPAGHFEAIEAGAIWLVADRRDCPGRDSRVLGPIPPERVAGRVVISWD